MEEAPTQRVEAAERGRNYIFEIASPFVPERRVLPEQALSNYREDLAKGQSGRYRILTVPRGLLFTAREKQLAGLFEPRPISTNQPSFKV